MSEQTTMTEINFISRLGTFSESLAVRKCGRKQLLKNYKATFMEANNGQNVDRKRVLEFIDNQIRSCDF